MKNLILIPIIALALTGCSHFKSTVTESKDNVKSTRVSAWTFFDSKSELAKVSAGQTDKSQRVGIGSLNQESTGTNAVQVLNALKGIVEAIPK